MTKMAPLPHEWMLVSIIGFFISYFQVLGWEKTWGVTFMVFFIMMFVASVVSMSGTGMAEEDMIELAIHNEGVRAGRHRK